jgi:hypothetical protein
MPKAKDDVTEKLLSLRVGASRFVSKPRLCLRTLREHLPGSAWRTETREGGRLVTRIR